MATDSITYQGRTYTATTLQPGDREAFAAPCVSRGTRRCMIAEPHSSYVHLVMGLAESEGTVAP